MAKTQRVDDPHMAQKSTLQAKREEGFREIIDNMVSYSEEEEDKSDLVEDNLTETLQAEKSARETILQNKASEGEAQTAEVIARLQTQIDRLEQEVVSVRQRDTSSASGDLADAGPGGYPWQYYKRPARPNDPMSGWIIAGPGGPSPKGRDVSSLTLHVNKGHKPITQYGVCLVPSDTHKLGAGGQFISMLKNGGAVEFPVSQILTYKWHIKPPFPGLRFPQVDEAMEKGIVRHFACRDCEFELWFLEDDEDTALTAFRHLRSKKQPDDGRHGYAREEAIQIMEKIGVDVSGRNPLRIPGRTLDEGVVTTV